MIATLAGMTAIGALVVVCGAAIVDVMRFEIPDGISLAVLVLAGTFGILTPGFGWLSHLAALGVMFAFGLVAFSRSWLGGGDVKLLSAIAAWTGLGGLPLMFIATSVAGGLLTIGLILVRFTLSSSGTTIAAGSLRPGAPMPYAVAIAAGTIWWVWATGGPIIHV